MLHRNVHTPNTTYGVHNIILQSFSVYCKCNINVNFIFSALEVFLKNGFVIVVAVCNGYIQKCGRILDTDTLNQKSGSD